MRIPRMLRDEQPADDTTVTRLAIQKHGLRRSVDTKTGCILQGVLFSV